MSARVEVARMLAALQAEAHGERLVQQVARAQVGVQRQPALGWSKIELKRVLKRGQLDAQAANVRATACKVQHKRPQVNALTPKKEKGPLSSVD
eukprot:1554447-Prymnesium_polylepis.1